MTADARVYPDALEITPLARPYRGAVQVPGSKSITNRALVLAALSDPAKGSELQGALRSEDTEIMVEGLRALGLRVQSDWSDSRIRVRRGDSASPVPARKADVFVGNSGTSMRFLTALVCLGLGRYRIDGVSRMRERPIEDLLSALRQLGADVATERGDGFPPVLVKARGLKGGHACIKGRISSQFLSGLLMAAPLARNGVTIEIDGPLVSQPYVEMTLRLMRHFGVDVASELPTSFCVPTVPWYEARTIGIEPDASAASYFFAAAAITESLVCIHGLNHSSMQGDVRFVEVLKDMGSRVLFGPDEILVEGRSLKGTEVDMNAMSDCVMTLAAVACFADGPTTIRNVAHIRHKETDRLTALSAELRRVGAEVDELADGLRIVPGRLRAASIETYNDHRMAMAMALVGLRVPGIVIKNPACVAKTYPRYFDDLRSMRC
jgi:3-phosphoshikimate 1-carboxyvinyltransferase